MDAVEFPLLTVSKLLSSEVFGRDGDVERREPITSVPVFGGSPVGRFSSSSSGRDVIRTVTAVEQTSFSRNKMADVGVCMQDGSLTSFGGQTVTRKTTVKDANSPLSFLPKCIDDQLQQKGGKPSKSSHLFPKRPKYDQANGSINHAKATDCDMVYGKYGSSLAVCTEKSRVVGRKDNLDGRRADKKILKPPSRTKYDSFFPKVGLVSTSSAAGGGNILGIYGLKSDIHDVTKHVDDLSLNDLLDGSYKYLSPCNDKGKKPTNTNENLLQTVKKACSIIQPPSGVRSLNASGEENNCNRKRDTCLLSSETSATCATDCSKSNDHIADLTSSKESGTISDTPSYQPKDILELVSLPPVKDLDSLLLDTSKCALPSRSCTDLRAKTMSYGAHLPPFSWSQCFNGHSKTFIDTGRLFTNRSKWQRIGSILSSLGDAPTCFSDLESITCDYKQIVKGLGVTPEFNLQKRHLDSLDERLKSSLAMGNLLRTPEAEGKVTRENDVAQMNQLRCRENDDGYVELEQSKSSSSRDFASSSHYGGCDQHQVHLRTSDNLIRVTDGHSPKLLAAAQILCEIARYSGVQDQTGKLRWPQKPSQKSMKARKSRSSTGKTEFMTGTPPTSTRLGDPFENTDLVTPSKRPKLSTSNRRKDASHSNIEGRELLSWSIPTSTRSPPIRSENAETPKAAFGLTPSSKRGPDKACNGEKKLRKAVLIDWGRARSKKEG